MLQVTWKPWVFSWSNKGAEVGIITGFTLKESLSGVTSRGGTSSLQPCFPVVKDVPSDDSLFDDEDARYELIIWILGRGHICIHPFF